MKHINITFLLFVCLATSITQAQKIKVREATDDYDKYAFVKTTEILEKVAEKGYTSKDLLQKLGNAYYFSNNLEKAAKWYGELVALDSDLDPEYFWRYAQALKGVENYTESDKWMKKFNETNPEDLRSKAFLSKVDYLSSIDKVSNDNIKIKNLDFNSSLSDFGTTQYQDQLIFASNRGGGKLHKWNAQPYLDLYSATKLENGEYANPIELNTSINTKYHESTAAYTPDDVYMFFTRNNYFNKRYKEGANETNRLKLFRATKEKDGSWGNVENIHFNSDDYSVAHPSINVQGNLMYFASDMPGAIGESDIYVVEINKDGTLGEPQNLGAKINTQGRESFPYINGKGDLYYSSNGYPGLGGLDVYVVKNFEQQYLQHNYSYVVENIGKPINSSQDDFGYYENLGTKEGFFSSNRDGGKGSDDIYSFEVLECKQTVAGLVKDKTTNEIIPAALVTIYDASGKTLESKTVGDDASFSFELDCNTPYLVRAEKETYIADEKRFTTPTLSQELNIELLLEIDEQEVKIGDDLAKVLGIPIIYFDFDKFNIRYDAEVELQKVLAVMNQYPNMVVDIRSHTDCRAPFNYNKTLSNNRAKSTRQYLINKGIDANRLTAMGYGESQLVNDCACEPTNESSCTEAEHQLNRRSEFIIVKM